MELKERLSGLLESYYEAASMILSSLFPSQLYDMELAGFGTDGIGVPLLAQKITLSQEELLKNIPEKTGISVARLYPTNVNCYMKDVQVSFANDGNKGFRAESASGHGSYKVLVNNLSADSNLNGLCTTGAEGKTYLDAVKCLRAIDPLTSNLAMYEPQMLVQISHEDGGRVKVKPWPVKELGQFLTGVRCRLVVCCQDWKSNAFRTHERPSGWPDIGTLNKIEACGPVLVANKNGLWTVNWEACEKILWQTMSVFVKESFVEMTQLLTLLFSDRSYVHSSLCFHLVRHSFLRCLEQNRVLWQPLDSKVESSHWNNIQCVLLSVSEGLANGFIPHFFMSGVNMLSGTNLSRDDRIQLANAIRDAIHSNTRPSTELVNGVCSEQLDILDSSQDLREERLGTAVLSRAREALRRMFNEQVKLWHLKLYSLLQDEDGLEGKVRAHTEQLGLLVGKMSRCKPDHRDLLEWVSLLVSNSLGSLYTSLDQVNDVNSHSVFRGMFQNGSVADEKQKWLKLAEEQYLRASNMDLLSGRVSLANFLLKSGRTSGCLELVDEILRMTGYQAHPKQSDPEVSSTCTSPDAEWVSLDDSFQEPVLQVIPEVEPCDFLADVIMRNVILDIYISRDVHRILPASVKHNISMCVTPLAPGAGISMLEPQIFARILRTLALMQLNQRNEAIEELLKLRHLCDKDQPDGNERRTAGCYNMIAQCFLELDLEQEARMDLEVSIKYLSNPGNPARWMLMNLSSRKLKERFKKGLGIALAVGGTAIVLGVLKGRGS